MNSYDDPWIVPLQQLEEQKQQTHTKSFTVSSRWVMLTFPHAQMWSHIMTNLRDEKHAGHEITQHFVTKRNEHTTNQFVHRRKFMSVTYLPLPQECLYLIFVMGFDIPACTESYTHTHIYIHISWYLAQRWQKGTAGRNKITQYFFFAGTYSPGAYFSLVEKRWPKYRYWYVTRTVTRTATRSHRTFANHKGAWSCMNR
jgi:hypothetical protein